MPGITFSKNSGLNDDLWKPTAEVLTAIMKDTDAEQNGYDDFIKAVANEKVSTKYAEKTGALTSLGNFGIVGEGDRSPVDEIQAGFSKLIPHKTFMNEFVCSKEMRDDGDIDMMKTAAIELVNSYKRTKAQYLSDSIVTEGSTFINGSTTIDKTSPDAVALFSASHPGIKSGVAVQSNVFTNAFGTDSSMLNRLANIGMNFRNDSGNIINYNYDTIIVPSNAYQLIDTIKKIIKTDLTVGSNYNDINTQKGLWSLVIDPLWQVSSGAPYVLMSSKANKAMLGTCMYDRIALDVQNETDIHTRNLIWNGYCRFSAGFRNWRHMILGGASAGTTLS